MIDIEEALAEVEDRLRCVHDDCCAQTKQPWLAEKLDELFEPWLAAKLDELRGWLLRGGETLHS